MGTKQVKEDKNMYIFECPHCEIKIKVKKNGTKCSVFRYGIYKNNSQEIQPH